MSKKLKLLLYCTKTKPQLSKVSREYTLIKTKDNQNIFEALNGKIVAECDFEVEEITNCGTSFMIMKYDDLQESYRYTNKIARGSCLDYTDLRRYLGTKNGYAIHIKNLTIFDKPKELDDYYYSRKGKFRTLGKAPQNMMYVQEVVPFKEEHLIRGVLQEFRGNRVNEYILISIRPEWMCLILNRIKDVEIRRVVLKEMLNNE